MRVVKIAYFLATILCLASCTATLSNPPPKQNEIKKELATHTYLDEFPFDPYPFVGSVRFTDNRLIGSGVVIAPNMILTAAHVAEVSEDLIFVEYDGDAHCVSEIIYYPEYIPGTINHDIAILILETESDEQPVEFVEHTHKRMKLTTVGYGTGRKRFSNYGVFWYYGRLVSNPQVMIMLPLNGSMWFGDSGGGVFTLNNKLVGIMSYFSVDEKRRIFENGCASIEYYKNWIEEVQNERRLERMAR